jgi:hypothetical protein
MNKLYIYTEHYTQRLFYIVHEIGARRLGANCEVVHKIEDIPKGAACIWYAYDAPAINAMHVVPAGLLFTKGTLLNNYYFKENDILSIQNRDFFSDSFYLLSRFEEYLHHDKDVYGNYLYKESVLYKLNVLQQPIIEIWVKALQEALQQLFPFWQWHQHSFKKILTVDVDIAYAYKGRSVWRNMLATAKDVLTINFDNISTRKKVFTNKIKDPFDTYEAIYKAAKHYDETILFFPAGPNGKRDRHIPVTHLLLNTLLNAMPTNITVGLHPTLVHGHTITGLANELETLQKNSNRKKIVHSRQHYLKMVMPATYNNLVHVGIQHDYTMCYNHVNGFRAGTCIPFKFYNVIEDKTHDLTIHSSMVLDSTFIYNQQTTVTNAVKETQQLLAITKEYGGEFVMVFHNNHIYQKHTWYPLWNAFSVVTA